MTPRPRRGAKFLRPLNPNGHTSPSFDSARRSSFSDVSDEASANKPKAVNASMKASTKVPSPDEKRAEYAKKRANFMTRTFWTFIMLGTCAAALMMGHIYVILIITIVQIISFKEVIAIASVPIRARQLRSPKNLNWFWLTAAMFFLYGESVIYYFKHIVLVDKVLLPLATHHRFISFVLYVFGFVFFVASLQAGNYRFQFTQFAWTHMALYLIVVQAHFVMNNIFEGMIWFMLPTALVTTNDIMAYVVGITFGRTQLIKLSPKKTVEGFVGAWISTIILGMGLANIMMRYSYFVCPVTNLGANIFTGLDCVPNPVFVSRTYHLPRFIFLPPWTAFSFTASPMQFHSFILATFASLIAPFGGFFASGLKRTFKIKDFGDSIPGHGGMTDRMDCQFIMGFFTYVYYHTFIAVNKVNLGAVMEMAITGLTIDEQAELVRGVGQYLVNQGMWKSEVLECIDSVINSKK